jgi:hypothetical protein
MFIFRGRRPDTIPAEFARNLHKESEKAAFSLYDIFSSSRETPDLHLARRFCNYFPPFLIYIILFTSTSVHLVYFSFFLHISLFTLPFSHFFFPPPTCVGYIPTGRGGEE